MATFFLNTIKQETVILFYTNNLHNITAFTIFGEPSFYINKNDQIKKADLLTLYEVNEHLQVSDLGFELLNQLLFDSSRVDDLSYSSVHSLPELLWCETANVFIQIHIQLLNQLIDDHLQY